MKIGIIGTGAIGGTIAKKMASAGHNVKVFNADDEQKLKIRAEELGVYASTVTDVAKDVDVLIISLPTAVIADLPREFIESIPEETIVVDTSNYYPFRDQSIDEIKQGKTESIWVSDQLGKPVIKAFNNLLAETLLNKGKSEGAVNRIAMAIAGDSAKAKKIIADLANDAGFDTVDSGSLEDSWRQQPGTPAYCTELNAEELQQALQEGDKEKAPVIRDYIISQFTGNNDSPKSHEEIVSLNRDQFPINPKTRESK